MDKNKIYERLTLLKNIKQLSITEDDIHNRRLKSWAKRTKPKEVDRTDIKSDLALSVKLTKDSELLAWTAEYEFMPFDDDGRRNNPLLKEVWAYRWMMSRTDKMLSRIIPSATTYWTWIMYEWIKTIYKNVKTPYYDDNWDMLFKDEKVLEYDGIYCEYIPIENFFIDWDDIDNSTEAIWIKYYDKDEYLKMYNYDSKYNLSNIPEWKEILTDEKDWIKLNQETNSVITELKYFNIATDDYTILANWVEVYSWPIPFTHKQLPFCLYYDYKIDWRIYWMWEFEILSEEEVFKDKLRSLSIDVIKSQLWTILIEDDIDFDTNILEYWTNTFIKTDNINWIKHFSPSISTTPIENAEYRLENEVISKTWIDFKAQVFQSWETAKKTTSKSEVTKKRINLNLKINWFDFYERLWRLRMANIQLLADKWEYKIPVKWRDIDNDWVYSPTNWGYWFFTVKPKFLKWKVNLVPITQTILWNTQELNKQRALELDVILRTIVWKDWQPVVSWENRLKRLCEVFEIDYDTLTSATQAQQSPEDILRSVNNEMSWVSNDTQSPDNPSYIPPEQRSWATKMLSWSNISLTTE